MPPIEIPTGTFAWMQDPEGNTVGLWKPKTLSYPVLSGLHFSLDPFAISAQHVVRRHVVG